MNKREFMLAAGAAGIAGAAWSAAPALNARGWHARVGQAYGLRGGETGTQLRLLRVASHASTPLQQFSLYFSASSPLAAGTHVLRAEDGHELALYLEAAGQDAGGEQLLRADCCQLG